MSNGANWGFGNRHPSAAGGDVVRCGNRDLADTLRQIGAPSKGAIIRCSGRTGISVEDQSGHSCFLVCMIVDLERVKQFCPAR